MLFSRTVSFEHGGPPSLHPTVKERRYSPPFNMTTFGHARKCRIVEMSYSTSYDMLVSNVVLWRFFKRLAYFDVNYSFVYIQ